MPDEQAEPDETATPSMSRDISKTCASIPEMAKVLVLGKPRRFGAEENRFGRDSRNLPLETVAPEASAAPSVRAIACRSLHRRGKAHDRGDILGPCPQTALLTAAAQHHVLYVIGAGGENKGPRRPCGPPNLCAEMASASAPSAAKSQAIRPAA